MDILVQNPVTLIASLSFFGVRFVVFCGTTLGTLTIVWCIFYMLVRPIPSNSIFAPFEKMGKRILNLGVFSVATIISYYASVILKNYFQIGRPILLNYDFQPLLTRLDYGFPSSHAATFAAIATTMFIMNRRAGIFTMLLALIIGAARIIAGVHTPLDIIAGYLLGTALAAIIGFISLRIVNPAKNKELDEEVTLESL